MKWRAEPSAAQARAVFCGGVAADNEPLPGGFFPPAMATLHSAGGASARVLSSALSDQFALTSLQDRTASPRGSSKAGAPSAHFARGRQARRRLMPSKYHRRLLPVHQRAVMKCRAGNSKIPIERACKVRAYRPASAGAGGPFAALSAKIMSKRHSKIVTWRAALIINAPCRRASAVATNIDAMKLAQASVIVESEMSPLSRKASLASNLNRRACARVYEAGHLLVITVAEESEARRPSP